MSFEQKRVWRRVGKSEEPSSGGALQCVEQRSDESTRQTWLPGAFLPEANCQHTESTMESAQDADCGISGRLLGRARQDSRFSEAGTEVAVMHRPKVEASGQKARKMFRYSPENYPYLEEVNEGILSQFRGLAPGIALDVGCGRGQLGQAIGRLGWTVWGVESSPQAAPVARDRLARLVEADLHDSSVVEAAIEGQRFDALIFSDVLEHVLDPLTTLEQYLPLLKPGGKVFISLPNYAAWTTRVLIVLGRVEYHDTGILDRTHLRFFSFASARAMMEAAGLQIIRRDCTPLIVRSVLPWIKRMIAKKGQPGSIADSPFFKLYQRVVYPVELTVARGWPELLAFRIILVGLAPEGPGSPESA
jgi:2-polyprenyl-3-methyl-5-hydroxy-6-metoxy-1,4-benzoquinol methylase